MSVDKFWLFSSTVLPTSCRSAAYVVPHCAKPSTYTDQRDIPEDVQNAYVGETQEKVVKAQEFVFHRQTNDQEQCRIYQGDTGRYPERCLMVRHRIFGKTITPLERRRQRRHSLLVVIDADGRVGQGASNRRVEVRIPAMGYRDQEWPLLRCDTGSLFPFPQRSAAALADGGPLPGLVLAISTPRVQL